MRDRKGKGGSKDNSGSGVTNQIYMWWSFIEIQKQTLEIRVIFLDILNVKHLRSSPVAVLSRC